MIRVTDNKEVKETVLAGLKHNKDKYGNILNKHSNNYNNKSPT